MRNKVSHVLANLCLPCIEKLKVFLMWLQRIFGKKGNTKGDTNGSQATPARNDTKRLALSEARTLLAERLNADEAVALRSCVSFRNALVRTLGDLKSAVSALAAADVPEPTATASKAIKDGFAQRAQAALARINVPEWASISVTQANLSELEHALAAVSVGPREAMHVKFFFEEQMAAIAALIHTSFETIVAVRNRLAPFTKKRKELDNTVSALDACEYAIAGKSSGIKQAELEIRSAKDGLTNIKFSDLAELQRMRSELTTLERSASDIDQQITSLLSPSIKLLKRFAYSADRHVAEFIRKIESDPAGAIYEDEERVKSVLASSLAAVRSGQISTDEKEVRRTEDVLSRFDELLALRGRRRELETKIDEMKSLIEREAPKERENSAAQTRSQYLENAIAANEMRVVELKREIGEMHERLGALKRKLSEFATAIIGESVEIV